MTVHFHRCPEPACRHIWSHDRDQIPAGGRDEAHTCPKCAKGMDYWAKDSMREALESDGVDDREHTREMEWGDIDA